MRSERSSGFPGPATNWYWIALSLHAVFMPAAVATLYMQEAGQQVSNYINHWSGCASTQDCSEGRCRIAGKGDAAHPKIVFTRILHSSKGDVKRCLQAVISVALLHKRLMRWHATQSTCPGNSMRGSPIVGIDWCAAQGLVQGEE